MHFESQLTNTNSKRKQTEPISGRKTSNEKSAPLSPNEKAVVRYIYSSDRLGVWLFGFSCDGRDLSGIPASDRSPLAFFWPAFHEQYFGNVSARSLGRK